MIQRSLGPELGPVGSVGIGTWAIGGLWWTDSDERTSMAAIHRALDEGMSLIDTAPVYGMGHSEDIVGKSLRGRRHQVILATKCGLIWHEQEGEYFFTIDDKPVYKSLRPRHIRYDIERSLMRLQTDYIDLYQPHWTDPATPVEDTMDVLMRLKEEGKIRAIGLSNADVSAIQAYLASGEVSSNQLRYNMVERDIEKDILPFCEDQNIKIIAHSSLAKGLLSGRFSMDHIFDEKDFRRNDPLFTKENIRIVSKLINDLEKIRSKYPLSCSQFAISWILSKPIVSSVLVGIRNSAQAMENAGGGRITFEPDDMEKIDSTIDSIQRA